MENNYPLYPELNNDGNKDAQELMNKFKAQAKKMLTSLLDDYMSEFYIDILPEIETDSWQNYRNTMMEGFQNYNNRHAHNRFDFKEIRQQIYNDFREDIIKDLNQDNLDKIAELEKSIEYLQQNRF